MTARQTFKKDDGTADMPPRPAESQTSRDKI